MLTTKCRFQYALIFVLTVLTGIASNTTAAQSAGVEPATEADAELPASVVIIEPESLPRGAALREIVLEAVDSSGNRTDQWNGTVTINGLTRRKILVDSEQPFEAFSATGTFENGRLTISSDDADGRHISVSNAGLEISSDHTVLASGLKPVSLNEWWRIVPPLIAILLAILIRDVNVSLILATLTGCLLYHNFADVPGAINLLCATLQNQLADSDHASVILFTVFLGAMIGLMNDSGGTQSVVNRMARFANTRERGQLLTWLMGLVVFFDDYANALLIGGAMRPLSDRLKISGEKLAFLID